MESDFGTLVEVLTWLTTRGGAMVLAGYVVAYFFENMSWWHGLPRWVKIVVPILLAGIFSIAATSILALGLVNEVPPQYQALLLALINWLFGQIAYRGLREDSYGKTDKAPSG